MPSSKDKGRMLLVEDNDIHREGLEDGLVDAGFEVRSVSQLSDARRELQEYLPDLFVIDMRLKSLEDGLDFAVEMTKEHGGAPVLLITAYMSEHLRKARAVDLARLTVLEKPFTLEELTRVLNGLRKAKARDTGPQGRPTQG